MTDSYAALVVWLVIAGTASGLFSQAAVRGLVIAIGPPWMGDHLRYLAAGLSLGQESGWVEHPLPYGGATLSDRVPGASLPPLSRLPIRDDNGQQHGQHLFRLGDLGCCGDLDGRMPPAPWC